MDIPHSVKTSGSRVLRLRRSTKSKAARRSIRKALAQEYFNGAQLGHGEANLTEGALVKPIDKLTGSDFFPDVIGMKEHFSFCHLFRFLHAYSTGCRFQVGVSMADDSKQAAASIGRNGFIWLLALAAGTYFLARQVPLEATRPPASEKIPTRASRCAERQRAAVARSLRRSGRGIGQAADAHTGELSCKKQSATDDRTKELEPHCQSPLKKSAAASLFVLVASVSGAHYSEDQEARRRTRYAVLAGLDTEGYAPEDPQHIGFFWPGKAAEDGLTGELPNLAWARRWARTLRPRIFAASPAFGYRSNLGMITQ
jgi:hypothetical protein